MIINVNYPVNTTLYDILNLRDSGATRDQQAEKLALRCLQYGSNITIIGKAHNQLTSDTEGSASLLVGHYIEKHGGLVNYYDLNTGDTELKLDWTEVFLLGYVDTNELNWDYWWVRHALLSIGFGPVIVDPWYYAKVVGTREIIEYNVDDDLTTYLPHYDTADYMKSVILDIWPELQKYKDKIHVVPAEVTTENTILLRPTKQIVRELLEAKANGATKFMFSNMGETIMPDVVTKIHRIANLVKHEINSNDIFYVPGAPDSQQAYEKMYEDKQRMGSFWKSKISILGSHYFHLGTQRPYGYCQSLISYDVKEKSKDFLCFNKVSRPHRVNLLEMMLEYDYIKRGYYSFEGAGGWLENFDKISDEYVNIKKNQNLFPIRLNISPDRINPVDIRTEDFKYFTDSYFSIVCETIFYKLPQDCVFISEKTYKCLAMMHPFILLARPGTLADLRKMGYKTFSPLIDESYDTIENDDDRLSAIFNEIHRLLKQNPSEWIEWQAQMKEIVEFNGAHFYSNTNYLATPNVNHFFN